MNVKILNKSKGDEIIKTFHSLLTRSTEKTCLAYVSSSDDNRVLTMYEYSTTINCKCPFMRMRQNVYQSIEAIAITQFQVDVLSLVIMFIKDITCTARSASCIDLHLQIDSLSMKLYNKRDDVNL